jgi:hypothetical protein
VTDHSILPRITGGGSEGRAGATTAKVRVGLFSTKIIEQMASRLLG